MITIKAERREQVSNEDSYVNDGNYLPRMIVWVDDSEDDQAYDCWSSIISGAIREFMSEHGLISHAFVYRPPFFRIPWTRGRSYRCVKREIDVDYVESRLVCHEDAMFLFSKGPLTHAQLEDLTYRKEAFDNSLIPEYGVGILDFGIEEAVVDFHFYGLDESLLAAIEKKSKQIGCQLIMTEERFVSAWDRANPKLRGQGAEA